MQKIESISSVGSPVETQFGRYTVRQRFLSASLSLAVTSSVSAAVSVSTSANPALGHDAGAWAHSGANAGTTGAGASPHNCWTHDHSGASSPVFQHAAMQAMAAQATAPSVMHTSPSAVNFGVGHAALQAAAHHSATNAAALSQSWHAARNTLNAVNNQAAVAHDVNLNSAAALYAASGLAGFHDLTLDIGGKQVQVFGDTKLTGAMLVAAQQVLADGGQDIKLNARGVATGGVFDMNAAAISAISDAVGGNIKSLYISRGVQAIDSLANLNLLGNLVNMGSIIVGALPGSVGQTVDSISAANIYNGWGGVITSSMTGALLPTDISLNAAGLFFNSGTVSSAGNLNITAATINNVYAGSTVPNFSTVPVLSAAQNVNLYTSSLTNNGLIASTGANVNMFNGNAANLAVMNVGGTIQALNGNINFNAPDYNGSAGIVASGGNWLSQQLNFNAGTGTIDANINDVTGIINGTGSASHINASTDNLNLGNICISGDPTYFNNAGDVTISGNLTGNPDLAIVASGNIIANGGSLDTSSKSGNGGTLTLIAGANFTTNPITVSNSNDTSTTLTISDSGNPGHGTVKGGFIDLSGIFLTGNTKNTALTDVTTASTAGKGGDVLMVAYAGTGKNSGSIIASAIPGEAGMSQIDATGTGGGGNITLLGAGKAMFGLNLFGGDIKILGGTPTITGGSGPNVNKISITNGTIDPTSGSFIQGGNTVSDVNFMEVVGSNVTVKTAGFISADVVVAAGAGGAAGANGAKGGNIDLNGSAIFLSGADATGGGGGGGNPSQNGGNGGDGGNITLKATGPIIIEDFQPAPGYLNVSGGGGGGGGGGGEATGAPGKGGTGGKAGTILVESSNSFFFAGGVYAAEGGAGGDGGAAVLGTAGGGGGGGGSAFGGGGGGGAAGTVSTGTGAAVGGGGGGGFYASGGGGAGAKANTIVTAGTGGSSGGVGGPTAGTKGIVISGTGQAGTDGSQTTGGQGGVPSGSGLTGGVGGVTTVDFFDTPGSKAINSGGGSNANPGTDGKEITTVNGTGQVGITVADFSGSPTLPIFVFTPNIVLTGTTKNAHIFATSVGDTLNLKGASMAAGSTYSVVSTSDLTIDADINGGAFVNIASTGKLQVNNATITGTNVSLQSFNTTSTSFDGDIDFGVGSLIKATNASLTAENNISANVAVDKLSVAAGFTSVTINAAATAAKSLTLLDAHVGSGGTFTLNSAQEIKVTKGITAFNGIVNLTETGNLSSTGINITSNINVVAPFTGKTGTVNLTTTGSGSIINSVPITAIDLKIVAGGAVGSSAKALATNVTGTLTVDGNSGALISIKDSNANSPTLTGKSTHGQSIQFVSAAKNLIVDNLGYTNVTINNTFSKTGVGATLTLNPTGSITKAIGDGLGTVSITTAAAQIDQGATVTVPVIQAKNLVLKSTASDVGGALGLSVSASTITASAAKGSVSIQDVKAATLLAGSALHKYSIDADGLTVAGAIGGDVISLKAIGTSDLVLNANVGTSKSTIVNLTAADDISQNNKAVVSGITVNLKSATSGDVGSLAQSILTKAGNLTVSVPTNNSAFINQTGALNLGASAGIGNSQLTLVSSGNLNIKGSVLFGSIDLTAPVVEIFGGGGGLSTSNNLTVTAPVVKVDTGSLSIATGSVTFDSASSLSISGDGAFTIAGALALGGVVGGKTTSSITLGDSKTGQHNPLAAAFNKTLSLIEINTKGNLTGSLQTIATNDSTLAGAISITAANIVNVNPVPSLAPIVIAAEGIAGPDGQIFLNLTGTQAVTLGNATVTKGAPQIQLSNKALTGGGTISVQSGGQLTVNANGVLSSGSGRNLSLIGAKGLSVTDAGLLNTGLSELTLSSGNTKVFTIGEGVVPVNGTAGDISATKVNVNAAGGIALATGHTSKATASSIYSNNTGVLTITGDDNSITSGTSLELLAKSGINLGDVKNGGINNPLKNIGSNKLDFLDINTGGNFTGDYGVIALKNGGGTLSITAGNIVNIGATPLNPIQLKAENPGGAGGGVILNLTGSQAVVLGNAAVLKGQPQYEISVVGVGGGFVDVKTAGALTVNTGGVTYGTGVHELKLAGGKGLSVNDVPLISTNLFSVNLTSGATTPFVIGATGKDLVNGTAGSVDGGSVSITSIKGLTVNSGFEIKATGTNETLTLNSSKLLNNGLISGKDAGSTLSFFDAGKSNLGISNLGTGKFQNFGTVIFNTGGAIDLGNLFTSSDTLATGLNAIDLKAGGAITFASTLPTLNVNPNGTINVTGASLVSKAATPIDFVSTGTCTVNITTTSALTVGNAKGNIFVNVTATGSTVNLISTGGTLTVNDPLSFGKGSLVGSSVVVNKAVTAGTAGLKVLATGKTGTITTPGSGVLVDTLGTLTLGQGSTKLGAAAIKIDAATVALGDATAKGALNVSNVHAASSVVSGAVPISAVNYAVAKDVNVGSISTTTGGITVNTAGSLSTSKNVQLHTVGGGINLIAGANSGNTIVLGTNNILTTSAGSILIQNNNLTNGTITIGSGVTILGSGTAKGVGQVSIVIGAIPAANTLVAGVQPVNTSLKATGGADVFFGTKANPNGTITATGSNILFAEGRNIVFDVKTLGAGAITINGGTITADPPSGAGVLSSGVSAQGMSSTGMSSTISVLGAPAATTLSGSVSENVAQSSQVSVLPAITAAIAASAERNSLMPGSIHQDYRQAIGQAFAGNSATSYGSGTGSGVGTGGGTGGDRHLERGAVLLSPETDTSVHTAFGEVRATSGSLALLVAFDGGVAVYNLHDTRKDAVVVTSGNHRVSVPPGRSTVITGRKVRGFEEVNPAPFVAYRRMVESDYGNGVRAFHSEFNLYSLMRGVDAIKKLIASDNPKTRKIASSMLKTAAILLQMGNDKPYQLMLTPQMTAMIGNNTRN